MNKEEIYQKAIDAWGIDSQLDMLAEECLELALAIRKLKRNVTNDTYNNVCEEYADVTIMMEQIKQCSEIHRNSKPFYTYKLERLWSRLENQQEKESSKSGEQSSK